MSNFKRILEIAKEGGYPLWLSTVGKLNLPETIRATGFSLDEQASIICVLVPEILFRHHLSSIEANRYATLLMASMITFESYQIKGLVSSVGASTSKETEQAIISLVKTIGIANEMGLPGQQVFDHLLNEPLLTIRIKIESVFEQTPRPNTGNKI